MNPSEFQELMGVLDKTLALFQERPPASSFDREIYEELRRVRETMIRAQRDLRDPNVSDRDSRSPLEFP